MSTDQQGNSIENQLSKIAEFCAINRLTVANIYSDVGISGLSAEHRPGFMALIEAASGDTPPFSDVVVLDVSRWGRFQDSDESAYYEYVLHLAGIRLLFCDEAFQNDGQLTSSIIKSVKRAMAAEFSKQLSSRVAAGARRIATAGFWCSGEPGYGFRRQIIGPDGVPLQCVERGEWKWLNCHRTALALGPQGEIDAVREIFRLYTRKHKSAAAIARALADGPWPPPPGGWRPAGILRILANEKYAGTLIYGRFTQYLGSRRRRTNPSEQVRVEDAHPAIISKQMFRAACQRQAAQRRFTPEEILAGLVQIYRTCGTVTHGMVKRSVNLPSYGTIANTFGSFALALSAAGIPPQSMGQKKALANRHRAAMANAKTGRGLPSPGRRSTRRQAPSQSLQACAPNRA